MDSLGLMYYNARWYDPQLGRFTSADTIVAGENHGSAATMQHVAGTMYTPLTVGYYEQPVLAKLNADNAFIQSNGGSLLGLTAREKREANIVGVPLSTQVFDRYAYSKNNPLRYIDPTGHITCGNDEIGCESFEKNGKTYYRLRFDGKTIVVKYKGNEDLIDGFVNYADRYKDARNARDDARHDMLTSVGIAGLSSVGLAIELGYGLAGCTTILLCPVSSVVAFSLAVLTIGIIGIEIMSFDHANERYNDAGADMEREKNNAYEKWFELVKLQE